MEKEYYNSGELTRNEFVANRLRAGPNVSIPAVTHILSAALSTPEPCRKILSCAF